MIKDFEFQANDIKGNPTENFKKNPTNKLLFSGLVIHGCDLYSSTKKFAVAKEWSMKINQEFTCQIDDEEKLGLPVTPYMRDLDKPIVLAKAEMGFIKFIQKPIWSLLNGFFENQLDFIMKNIEDNIKNWELILEEEILKT
jgi:cAMP-specific phosphodiesterase 4